MSIPLLFILLSFLFSLSHSEDLCHPHDKRVLFRIKNQLGNPPSLATWDPKVDCCKWVYDMRCNEQGHITTFFLGEAYDIHHTFPLFLDELPSLTGIQIDRVYNLSGPIPFYISKLTNLTTFVIYDTDLSGPIPKFLGQFAKLTQLMLISNTFTGMIPDLSRLKSLTYLDLRNNKLTGPVPSSLAKLTSLTTLYLCSNNLSGEIPDFAKQMKSLVTVGLAFNRLTGPIPMSLGRSPKLEAVYLMHNKLTGDASFLLEKNNSSIQFIDISYNLLKFDFSHVDLSRNILNLQMMHNMVYGSLPVKFGFLNPISVDVSYNQLCGPIPNGRRFKHANRDIFAHNKCLCGGPLPACK